MTERHALSTLPSNMLWLFENQERGVCWSKCLAFYMNMALHWMMKPSTAHRALCCIFRGIIHTSEYLHFQRGSCLFPFTTSAVWKNIVPLQFLTSNSGTSWLNSTNESNVIYKSKTSPVYFPYIHSPWWKCMWIICHENPLCLTQCRSCCVHCIWTEIH